MFLPPTNTHLHDCDVGNLAPLLGGGLGVRAVSVDRLVAHGHVAAWDANVIERAEAVVHRVETYLRTDVSDSVATPHERRGSDMQRRR